MNFWQFYKQWLKDLMELGDTLIRGLRYLIPIGIFLFMISPLFLMQLKPSKVTIPLSLCLMFFVTMPFGAYVIEKMYFGDD